MLGSTTQNRKTSATKASTNITDTVIGEDAFWNLPVVVGRVDEVERVVMGEEEEVEKVEVVAVAPVITGEPEQGDDVKEG